MKKPKTKIVRLRLPKVFLDHVRHIAKAAGVTPTQCYNVLLALHLAKVKSPDGDGNE